jgi:predicted Ser/Thr protein kinase
VDCCDAFLLGLLADNSPITPAETIALTNWWQKDRLDDEGLAHFLTRQQVLVPEADHMLRFMRQGHVTLPDAFPLFAPHGVEKARRHLGPVSRASGETFSDQPVAPQPSTSVPSFECFTVTEHNAVQPHLDWSEPPVPRPGRERRRGPVEAGQVLGKCLLLDEIGRGGSSVVFRGFHQGLQVPVAVKVLLADDADLPEHALVQFRQEARLLARLRHPHVVGVLDFESTVELCYLVLEYVDGVSLHDLIRHCGRLCWDRVARLGLQVAEALAAANRLGIIHRDIKPANILIHRDGQAKLADLGLAVVRRGEECLRTPGEAVSIAGTVAYMAPEQGTASAPVDHRSDIYALGATLYHAVTGRMPFVGRTPAEVLRKHAEAMLIPPHRLVPDLNPSFSQTLCRMLAKNPQDRFASYDELIAALKSVVNPTLLPLDRTEPTRRHDPATETQEPSRMRLWWQEWSAWLERWRTRLRNQP